MRANEPEEKIIKGETRLGLNNSDSHWGEKHWKLEQAVAGDGK